MPTTDHESLRTQIRFLRKQLEDAALRASAEETLALSRRMDALLNRLMLSGEHRLRRNLSLSESDLHIYCAAPAAGHTRRRSVRPQSVYRRSV